MPGKQDGNEAASFIGGLILGLLVSAPVAAWMSPRSGSDLRKGVTEGITQRGMIIRRTLRKPVEKVQEQLEQLRGDSVDEALEEGRAIAAQRQHEAQS